MRPTKRRTLLLLAAMFVIGLAAFGAVLYPKATHQWTAPLGPALELPTYTPTHENPTVTPPSQVGVASTEASVVQASTQAPGVALISAPDTTPTPQPFCGGPPVMAVLGIGADSDDYDYGLADVIRVARVDFVTPKVSVLSMPRALLRQSR